MGFLPEEYGVEINLGEAWMCLRPGAQAPTGEGGGSGGAGAAGAARYGGVETPGEAPGADAAGWTRLLSAIGRRYGAGVKLRCVMRKPRDPPMDAVSDAGLLARPGLTTSGAKT
jgi:hypothetical protein